MVLCLVTLTDLQTRRAGLLATAEVLVLSRVSMQCKQNAISFLPRDAIVRKRGLCCRSVSVRHCRLIRWLKNFQTSFSARGSAIDHERRHPNPTPILSAGAPALNTRGGKNCDFRLKSPRLSRNDTKWANCCYGTLIERHRWRIDHSTRDPMKA